MSRRYAGPEDPLWYKDAVFYQLHVRSFQDSNADGIGDFRGLSERLDYFKDLGIDTLWLLPFYPSPLKDDGYDIADYTKIHPSYGTMADFTHFLREAHERGLRVLTELVLNHTSDRHPWFQRARRAPSGSRARDFYVWSDTPERYPEARIIFKDFETSNWAWDPLAKAYFWHRFYSHQPDLNFDNPDVHKAVLQVLDFWLGLGVDGLRLDAVPYLYEREDTDCENLDQTHAFLKKLRRQVDARHRSRALLAEANQWPEDAAAYLGEGQECHMAFHFPIMPRMFMAVHMEDRYPLMDVLEQTPTIPDVCQWALFLRNHDELTLEMVTDEERDYMYRVYAHDPQARINLGIRRRLAPLLGNNRRKIELLNGLLFSLPGTPIVYYGDEIGMGDNIYLGDRNGVRTPMQWSSDRNAGFSRANPQRLFLPVNVDPEYHYEAVNVEAQRRNPHALFWWMKRLIALRRRFKAFGRGTMEPLAPENRKVLAFVRRHENETILVVANLSRFAQYVELDLSPFRGRVPVELFGRTEFPLITEAPYLLTLGPHAFLWFALEPSRIAETEVASARERNPTLEVPSADWSAVFRGRPKAALESALAVYLQGQRWFAGKARRVKSARIEDEIPLGLGEVQAMLALVQIEFAEGTPHLYAMALAFAHGEHAGRIAVESPQAVLADLVTQVGEVRVEGILYDAAYDADFCSGLLDAVARRRRFRGRVGRILASPTSAFRRLKGAAGDEPLSPTLLKGEQSNTSVVYGNRFILKLLRRLEEGPNPDLEMGRFLTERARFPNVPLVAGLLEYRGGSDAESIILGILNGFVPNLGDAWSYTLDGLRRYFEACRLLPSLPGLEAVPSASPLALAGEPTPPAEVLALFGGWLEDVRMLGLRTAELHLALAGDREDPDFAPEPFTPFYQRALYQSMRGLVNQTLPLLKRRLKDLPSEVRAEGERVLELEGALRRRLREVERRKIRAMRLRCHGDFHLGQVLHTGKDFVILDFEGEPARPLGERRLKRSPLRDVAGMLRSFHYAAYAGLFEQEALGQVSPDQLSLLEPAARLWNAWVGATYLRAYLEGAKDAVFLPSSGDVVEILLNALLLEKGIYELGYELNNRPSWVRIPLRGLLQLLES